MTAAQDLLAERRAVIRERAQERCPIAREMLRHDVARIDAELEQLRVATERKPVKDEPPAWERKLVTHEWVYASSGDWCLLWLGCGVGWQAGSWLGRCYPLSRPIQPSEREESGLRRCARRCSVRSTMQTQAATLAETDGILAVVIGAPIPRSHTGPDHLPQWVVEVEVGDDVHTRLLRHALHTLDHYEAIPPADNAIRLTAGDHTYLVQREGSHAAAVCFPTGHPCAKSIRRTIRRMARRALPQPPKRDLASLTYPTQAAPTNPDPGPVAGGV